MSVDGFSRRSSTDNAAMHGKAPANLPVVSKQRSTSSSYGSGLNLWSHRHAPPHVDELTVGLDPRI